MLDPIEYPTVTIGAATYHLKYNCAAIILLKQRFNLDFFALPKMQGANAVLYLCQLTSIGILHETKTEIDPLLLAEQLEYWQMKAIDDAIAEALKKVWAQAGMLPEATPTASQS